MDFNKIEKMCNEASKMENEIKELLRDVGVVEKSKEKYQIHLIGRTITVNKNNLVNLLEKEVSEKTKILKDITKKIKDSTIECSYSNEDMCSVENKSESVKTFMGKEVIEVKSMSCVGCVGFRPNEKEPCIIDNEKNYKRCEQEGMIYKFKEEVTSNE